jgi:hypothetical protein
MTQYYTYIYKDPSRDYNGKSEPFYVGKGSKSVHDRAFVHLTRKDKHPLTHRIQKMKKDGVEPIIEKIIVGTNWKFALGIETMLIKRIGRKDLGTGPLLNLTNGGENPPSWLGKKRPNQSGENNFWFGKDRSGENGPFFGKVGYWKDKKNLEQSKRMKGKPPWNKGKECSYVGDRNRIESTCNICGFTGKGPGMIRYHFDNCKRK